MSLGLDGCADADEVFATNSLVEIAPVVELDGKKLSIGPVTQRLQHAYRQLVREELGL
jgi:branched-subunit amino acid aminotransferase/4-amino-4-deoxychorismate lyase